MPGALLYVGDLRQKEHLLSASITVDTADELKQLFLEFGAAGVVFHQKSKRELGRAELRFLDWTEVSSWSRRD